MKQLLREQILAKCWLLLSEINRDPASSLCGCFDRRFWAWKLVDFPEATFQRNLYPLSWFSKQPEAARFKDQLISSVISGLEYTSRLQHKNGSFDQAYPFEQSYGASAFLLPDLLSAYQIVEDHCGIDQKNKIENCLRKTADFLARREELHGYISNHLAGAALGLLNAGLFFNEKRFVSKAKEIAAHIIEHQSDEGWYPEYGGADPGYQTLCMHYLGQYFRKSPSDELKKSLEKSMDFLQYFVHPDGSFGGEYGSRRTEIYYPGGIAILANESPAAAAIHQFMLAAIENGQTVSLKNIDMGNTAPLLSSSILALNMVDPPQESFSLPCTKDSVMVHFPQAGIAVKSTKNYYAIAGASNGSVLKIFDKGKKRLILDDCGLLGITLEGKKITSQITNQQNPFKMDEDILSMDSRLYQFIDPAPTPFLFLILRALNLTLMRLPFFNEWIKRLMVKRLIKSGKAVPLRRKRTVTFGDDLIEVEDHINSSPSIQLLKLSSGGKFSSIHMASARYFNLSQIDSPSRIVLDVEKLNKDHELTIRREIRFDKTGGNILL